MRISTLGYVGKQGVKNIGRNKMFSIASIATMSACIFLFGLFFSIVLNLQHFVKTAEEGVAITVFFDEDATESQIEEIGKELRSRDDVLKVEYVSEDDAWNSFKEEYFGDNPELADGFKDDNPLAGSSSYAVYMKPQEDKDSNMISKSKSLSATQKELVKFAEGLDGVRKVNKSDVVANTLSSVNVLVGYVSIAIILILFGVSIINMEFVDTPDTLEYNCETLFPDTLYSVTMHIGFRIEPRVSLYLRQVVEDLVTDER